MIMQASTAFVFAFALLLASSVSSFVPTHAASSSCRVSTAQNALADKIFGMDLFAPVKDQNNYGARAKKNLKLGKITEKSYIPNGLTKEQYEKIRKNEKAKKDANYARNVKKAFKYTDFTEWYKKRGTAVNGSWLKSVTLGHSMAKTKYDWSGTADAKKFESVVKSPAKTASKKK